MIPDLETGFFFYYNFFFDNYYLSVSDLEITILGQMLKWFKC